MKRLFTIIAVVFFYSANAQYSANGPTNKDIDLGIHLTKAADNFKAGAVTGILGTGTMALSTVVPVEYKKMTYGISGAFGVISLITTWCAFNHIGQAGDIMQSRSASITVTPQGFAYKF